MNYWNFETNKLILGKPIYSPVCAVDDNKQNIIGKLLKSLTAVIDPELVYLHIAPTTPWPRTLLLYWSDLKRTVPASKVKSKLINELFLFANFLLNNDFHFSLYKYCGNECYLYHTATLYNQNYENVSQMLTKGVGPRWVITISINS